MINVALDGRPVDYPRDSPDYNPSISTSRSIATHLAEERQARRAKWTTLLDEAQQRGDTEMITKFTLYLQESNEMEQQEQDIAQHVAKVRKEAGKSAVYVPSGANTLESSDGDGGEEGEEERDGGYDSSDTIVVDLAAYFATPEAYKYVTGQHSAYRPPLPPPAPVVVKGSDERDSAVPHPGPLPPTKHTDRYENESLPGMHLQGDSEGTMGRECIPLTATWDIVMIDVNSNDDYIKQHLPTIEKEGNTVCIFSLCCYCLTMTRIMMMRRRKKRRRMSTLTSVSVSASCSFYSSYTPHSPSPSPSFSFLHYTLYHIRLVRRTGPQ